MKYAMDRILAALLLVVLLPLLVAIGAIALLDGGWPVLYRARRVGQGGRAFQMLKFRTMVRDADQQLQSISHLNLCVDPRAMVKIPNDPRVTRLGRFLRRTSLDELPQLVNILRGEMSFVGPRPPEPHEIDAAGVVDLVRLRMRPGLTGLWQIHDRHNPSQQARVAHDLDYQARWSPLLDIQIIARTIPAVIASGRNLQPRTVITLGSPASETEISA